MNLKEKTYFLGLGCAGGKLHKEFIALGYKGGVANGSEQDMKALGDVPTKYKLEGFDGFGGHRDRAIDCLSLNKEFIDFVENISEEIVFILFGGGGSTGSGCATVIAELLLENKQKIVCPVIALPSEDESITKHSNAYQAVQELQDLDGLGATFFINNNVGGSYNYINSTFAKMLDVFITNNSYGELNNFDESERMEMLRDNGAMVLSLMGGGKELCMLDKLTRTGIFVPIENNSVCENIGIMHAGKNNRDITSDMVIAEVGKPRNVFEGYNARNTLISVSGLDYPVTHVSKLGELAQKAYDERKRNKGQSTRKKLGELKFWEDDEKDSMDEKKGKKKTSRLDLLRKK